MEDVAALARLLPEVQCDAERRRPLDRGPLEAVARRLDLGRRPCDHVPAPLAKRSSRKSEMSWAVAPPVTRSARISPTTEQNLKPWPEKPAATIARSDSGWRSTRKCSSGESSKRHVFRATVGPAA